VTLTQIITFCIAALAIGIIKEPRWRGTLLLLTSLLAVYWLQAATPIRYLDFWLPTFSILLTVLIWLITREPHSPWSRQDLFQGIAVLGIVLLIASSRYLGPICCLTPSRPPAFPQALIAVILLLCILFVYWKLQAIRRLFVPTTILIVVILFLILKSETLATLTSAWLRRIQVQDYHLASPLDLRWLGYSYLAFRLLHILRDRQLGNAHGYSLGDFAIYALFFPTLTAGPIDRSGRFLTDLHAASTISTQSLQQGGKRILLGAFQKFVIADSLALFALSSQNAAQTTSPLWTWVMLYAYAFRIYFDFAGYTDITLGLGLWLGIRLPENFAAPYSKANLTAFWNSWHITLAQWFRAYFFNPITRSLRLSSKSIPVWMVILVGQVGTMVLIGLWHGVTWNFTLWGLWHAAGLYLHNRWSQWVRTRNRWVWWSAHPIISDWVGRIMTFHYVTLGWVWFALPDIQISLRVFKRLFSL